MFLYFYGLYFYSPGKKMGKSVKIEGTNFHIHFCYVQTLYFQKKDGFQADEVAFGCFQAIC